MHNITSSPSRIQTVLTKKSSESNRVWKKDFIETSKSLLSIKFLVTTSTSCDPPNTLLLSCNKSYIKALINLSLPDWPLIGH